MPRVTATIATLLLVGASIGINMARYPVVWQMTRPPAVDRAALADPMCPTAAGRPGGAAVAGRDPSSAADAACRAAVDPAAVDLPTIDAAAIDPTAPSAEALRAGRVSAAEGMGGSTGRASAPGGCTAEFCPIVPLRRAASAPGQQEPPAAPPSFEAMQPSGPPASPLVPVFMPDEVPSTLTGESARHDGLTDRGNSLGGSADEVRRLPPAELPAETAAPAVRLIAQPIDAATGGIPLYPTTQSSAAEPRAEEIRSGAAR